MKLNGRNQVNQSTFVTHDRRLLLLCAMLFLTRKTANLVTQM
jgi:hypothetical protein